MLGPAEERLTRAAKREVRTREILDAAMELVLEGGLEGLTIVTLAARVDAAVGALYRYFPGKEALVAALQTDAVEALRGDLERRLEAVEAAAAKARLTGPARALARAAAAPLGYLAEARRAPARHRLIAAVLTSPDPVLDDARAQALEGSVGRVLELAAARLEAAVAEGALEPGDARARTTLAWAAVQGLLLFDHRDRLVAPAHRVDALAGPLLVTLLRGWGAEPRAAERGVAVAARA